MVLSALHVLSSPHGELQGWYCFWGGPYPARDYISQAALHPLVAVWLIRISEMWAEVRCDITGIELFKIFAPSSSSTIRGRRFWGPGRGWRHKIKPPSLHGDGSLLPTRVAHIGQWLKTKIEFYGINSIGEDIELQFIFTAASVAVTCLPKLKGLYWLPGAEWTSWEQQWVWGSPVKRFPGCKWWCQIWKEVDRL